MHLLGFVAAVIAVAATLAASVVSLLGASGARNAALDVTNSFAPVTLAVALFGAGAGWMSIGPGAPRWALMAICLLVLAANLRLIAPQLLRLRVLAPSKGQALRVLSANVWMHNPTPELALAAILARQADVVFLQEADGSLANSMTQLKSRYPYAVESPNGAVRIFLKSPIFRQGWGLGLSRSIDCNSVWAETKLPDERLITLATVHFPQPLPAGPQEAMREALAAQLRRTSGPNAVLTGDFNTTPWSFAMRRQDAVFLPLVRRTIAQFSFPARLAGRRWVVPLLPIDHLYASPAWKLARLQRVRIPGSDHFASEAVLWLDRAAPGPPKAS